MEILNFLISNLSLKRWSSLRKKTLTQLMHKGKLLPFSTLQAQYRIPAQDLFTHNQISSYLSKNPIPTILLPSKSYSFWTSSAPKVKGITLFYNTIKSKLTFVKTQPLKKMGDGQGKSSTIRSTLFTQKSCLTPLYPPPR